jgi:hypothetical protein
MAEIDENLEKIETKEDAEALLNNLDSEESGKTASLPDSAPAAPVTDSYEFTVGGKVVKADRDQLLKWATMGYEAPNQIGSLRKELDSWKQKEPYFKEIEGKYKAIDDYARQNPQWLTHIQTQYEQTLAQQQQSNPLLPKLQTLEEQVNDVLQFKQSFVQQQEDKAYQTDLATVKKNYPKIDLDTPDESGRSLEYKVLEFAQKEGIRSFDKAFKLFYHDELLNRAREEAKENLIKDKVAKSKLGLLSTNSAPTTSKEMNVKGKSYNQLADDVIKQLGLT